MARCLSQEQKGVGITNELSFLEDRDHLKEESRDLRVTPSTGQCHAPAITSCLLLLLQTQLCTWGQWDVNSEGIGQVARTGTGGLGLEAYSCISCAADLSLPNFGLKPKGSHTHFV